MLQIIVEYANIKVQAYTTTLSNEFATICMIRH